VPSCLFESPQAWPVSGLFGRFCGVSRLYCTGGGTGRRYAAAVTPGGLAASARPASPSGSDCTHSRPLRRKVRPGHALVAALAQATGRLEPAEVFLDAPTQHLAHPVAFRSHCARRCQPPCAFRCTRSAAGSADPGSPAPIRGCDRPCPRPPSAARSLGSPARRAAAASSSFRPPAHRSPRRARRGRCGFP